MLEIDMGDEQIPGDEIARHLLHAVRHGDEEGLSKIIHRTARAFVHLLVEAQAEQLSTLKELLMSDFSELSQAITDLTTAVSDQAEVVDRVDQKVTDLETAASSGQDTAPLVAALRTEIDSLKSSTDKLSSTVPDPSVVPDPGTTGGTTDPNAGGVPTDPNAPVPADGGGTDAGGTTTDPNAPAPADPNAPAGESFGSAH